MNTKAFLRAFAFLVLVLSACSKEQAASNKLTVRPIETGSPTNLAWEVDLSVEHLNFEPAGSAFRVTGPDLYPLAQPGEPDLVATSAMFSIPEGWSYSASLMGCDASDKEGIDIAPYELSYRCEQKAEEVVAAARIYQSYSAFPQTHFNTQTLGTQDGQTLVRLTLNPLLYSPMHRRLTTARTMTVRLEAKGDGVTPKSAASDWLASLTANGERAATPRHLLVIAADTYRNDPVLARWIEWKSQAGFDVEVTTPATTGRSTAQVLSYLNSHTASGDFVLLIGNDSHIATYNESVGWQIAATDWPYARISATSPFPSRFVGRITASSTAQLRTQLQRALDADQAAGNTAWYPRASTIASAEGYAPSDVQYAQSIESLLTGRGFDTVDRFYESSRNAYPDSIRSVLTSGRSWLTYFGHGSGTAWTSTNTHFTVSDVYKIDNRGRLPMIVDVACDNGAWTKLEPSFSEAWMNLEVSGEPAGSVGYFGGSVKVSWHEPAVMSVGVSDYRFRRGAALMGQAVFAGQMYMLEKLGVNRLTLNNLSSYNLFGDPTVLVRSRPTRDYALQAQAVGSTLTVNVSDGAGNAASNLYVGISADGIGLHRQEIYTERALSYTLPTGATNVKVTAYGDGWVTKQIDL